MNFYDEAIEAKHQLQLDLVRKRRVLMDLVKSNKSVQEIATPDLMKGVLYDHDISVLEDADPYFWEPRITQMVLATGQQLPITVQFDLGWLQGKAGYWWFGRSSPLIGVTNKGERKYVNALLWNMDPNGSVSVETFHVVGRDQYPLGALTWDEGQTLEDAMAQAGRLEEAIATTPDIALRSLTLQLTEQVKGLSHDLVTEAQKVRDIQQEIIDTATLLGEQDKYKIDKYTQEIEWANSRAKQDSERFEIARKEHLARLDEWASASQNALQLFACGCLWLQQKIVTASQAPLTRAAQRRLERQNIDPKCLVVELRSKQYTRTTPGEEKKQVDWAWQWAVRGHWREQPTKEGYKLIWIHPFIKGPEDKPLKPDAGRVFAVTR